MAVYSVTGMLITVEGLVATPGGVSTDDTEDLVASTSDRVNASMNVAMQQLLEPELHVVIS